MELHEIRSLLTRIGGVGQGPDGAVTRLLFSPAYERAAALLQAEMEATGLRTWRDTVGNVHGVLQSGAPSARTLYLGSHLDTVQEGGLYDGALGVVAALVCARELQRSHTALPYHLHILATNGEEGNDLGGTFGSRCMMGLVDPDRPGYLEIAAGFGIGREEIVSAALDLSDALGYLELHIEQGKTLEQAALDIGIVTGIVGLRRYAVTALGEANHAGTTMMEFRRDALVASAKLITQIDALARGYGHRLVATVGKFAVFPNSAPVIPGKTEFVLEMRSQEPALMDAFYEQVRQAAAAIPEVEMRFAPLVDKPPVHCDAAFIEHMEAACIDTGVRFCHMASGATHDGNAFALRMPVGMLFVPSKGGISHNKAEFTSWEQIGRGVETLYRVLLSLGQEQLKEM